MTSCEYNQPPSFPKDVSSTLENRWVPLPDPDSIPPVSEPGLSSLYSAIRTTVGEEVKIVEHVFPNPGTVVQIFLMRVFAQSVGLFHRFQPPAINLSCPQIQQYLESLLNKAAAISALAFLRILKLAHAQTANLVEFLKSCDPSAALFRLSESKQNSSSSKLGGGSSSGSSVSGPSVALSLMLDSAMDELFVPYTEGQRYMERELKSINDLFMLNLFGFAKWHVSLIISSILQMIITKIYRSLYHGAKLQADSWIE